MMVLSDRKFNEEQLLLETFFTKMHVERDIRKKLIFKFILGVKTSIKKAPGGRSGGFNMLFRTPFSNLFHIQTFAGLFSKFSPSFTIRPRLDHDGTNR